jgi:hypothetical protein
MIDNSLAILFLWIGCCYFRSYAVASASTMASYGGAVKYIHTPMHEILQTELYVAVNDFQEIVVSYAGRGTYHRMWVWVWGDRTPASQPTNHADIDLLSTIVTDLVLTYALSQEPT